MITDPLRCGLNTMNRWMIPLISVLVIVGASQAAACDEAKRPNVLLILADDLGYSDLGCYGSKIETPNLDRLAAGGLRFSQFTNTAKCHSSRISLLTGRYAYQAGGLAMNRAVTAAEALGAAGYFTAMTGKWQLDREPTDFGFQRYFGHLSGACNYYQGDKTFRLNGEKWLVPKDGFYTTIANVDFAKQFLAEAREEKKPWFMYVAFNAPHAPVQPLEKDYRKYLGRYDVGWDVIREARLRRQTELGLFGSFVLASQRPEHIPAWDKLSPEQRAHESRRMAGHAGLIDRLDQEIGRLVDDVRKAGELDNTLILFFSDNGACPFARTIAEPGEPYEPDTNWGCDTGWAWMRNSPFRYYKQDQFEGGVATPGIVYWPAGLKTKPGSIDPTPAHLVDVLPTLLDVAGAKAPTSWPDRELTPMSGISLAPILSGEKIASRPPIHFQFGPNRGLRDGDWKLVSFGSSAWELYNLANDRAELLDVAAEHPEVRDRLVETWHRMAKDDLNIPDRLAEPVGKKPSSHLNPKWTDYSRNPDDLPTKTRKSPGKKAAAKAAAGNTTDE